MVKPGITEEKPPHPVTPPHTSWLRKSGVPHRSYKHGCLKAESLTGTTNPLTAVLPHSERGHFVFAVLRPTMPE